MNTKSCACYFKRTIIQIVILILIILAAIIGCLCFLLWLFGNLQEATNVASLLFGQIGNLLLGIAAMYGVNVFANERKKRRSDAAAFILAKIRKSIAEIVDIADKRVLYQYASYPTKLFSENTDDEKFAYPEIPARMIDRIAQQLKIDLLEPSAHLSLSTITALDKIVEEFQQTSKNLEGAVYHNLQDINFANTIELVNDTLTNYRHEYATVERRAKTLLGLIIETGE